MLRRSFADIHCPIPELHPVHRLAQSTARANPVVPLRAAGPSAKDQLGRGAVRGIGDDHRDNRP